MTARRFALGKRPPREDRRTLRYATYRDPETAIAFPSTFGHDQPAAAVGWGLLGNDRYGDCVFAGAGHEHMLWTGERGGAVAPFTAGAVLGDYSAVTGFDPNDPSTDQGTVTLDALNYRRKVGVADARGARHKIAAFVQLDLGNWVQVLEAIYLFGAVGFGFSFPVSAWSQFDAGKTWGVVSGSKIDGGHYVPLVARRDRHLLCVTWGKTQALTKAFLQTYGDEAWALLTYEHLAGGASPEGFDLAALQRDLAALGSRP